MNIRYSRYKKKTHQLQSTTEGLMTTLRIANMHDGNGDLKRCKGYVNVKRTRGDNQLCLYTNRGGMMRERERGVSKEQKIKCNYQGEKENNIVLLNYFSIVKISCSNLGALSKTLRSKRRKGRAGIGLSRQN